MLSLTICPLDCTSVVREAVRTASPPRSHAAIATCHDGDFAFQALQGDLQTTAAMSYGVPSMGCAESGRLWSRAAPVAEQRTADQRVPSAGVTCPADGRFIGRFAALER